MDRNIKGGSKQFGELVLGKSPLVRINLDNKIDRTIKAGRKNMGQLWNPDHRPESAHLGNMREG